jgi:Ca-activated chloride channel family protein
LKEFHFTYPEAFGLFIFILPYILYRLVYIKETSILFAPLQHNKAKNGFLSIYFLLFLELMILIISILGVADPHISKERSLVVDEGIDIALALDVSASMQATDFSPNRLESMKKIAADFINKSTGNRIGIFIFAKECFTQTPLTTDHYALNQLLESISYSIIDHSEGGGTAIGDALICATDSLVKLKIPKRGQAIILITDGESSYGIEPELAAKYTADNKIKLYIIGMAGENPIQVYVNGKPFITPTGEVLTTSLDDSSLQKIAVAADGKYYRANSDYKLGKIFEELAQLEKTPIEINKTYNKTSLVHYSAISCIFLLAFWLYFNSRFVRRPIR